MTIVPAVGLSRHELKLLGNNVIPRHRCQPRKETWRASRSRTLSTAAIKRSLLVHGESLPPLLAR